MPRREIAEILESFGRLRLQLRRQLCRPCRVADGELPRRAAASRSGRRAAAGRRRGCCAQAASLAASWAATIRWREARSSSIRRDVPQDEAGLRGEVAHGLSFAGFIGSLGGIASESAPSSSPWWRTSTACPALVDGRQLVSLSAAVSAGTRIRRPARLRAELPPTRSQTVADARRRSPPRAPGPCEAGHRSRSTSRRHGRRTPSVPRRGSHACRRRAGRRSSAPPGDRR